MALIWKKQLGKTCYEVRKAGNSLRLFTNGLFHSQYNPQHVLSGSVWDLLSIPVLFYPPQSIKRVLLLGVGGGAVVQQLRVLCEPKRIVGVELDPVHLQVTRRFFGVKGKDVELHCANAVDFVGSYRGEKFDLIIDDLFMEKEGEPTRAVEANLKWFRTLNKLLNKDGLLVMNFADRPTLQNCSVLRQIKSKQKIRPAFKKVFSLKVSSCYNHIAVFCKRSVAKGELRKSLKSVKAAQPAIKKIPEFLLKEII